MLSAFTLHMQCSHFGSLTKCGFSDVIIIFPRCIAFQDSFTIVAISGVVCLARGHSGDNSNIAWLKLTKSFATSKV